MGMTTSLVALALWGSDPVPPATPPAPTPAQISAAGSAEPIVCEVQVMTVAGLDWRNAAWPMLRPAARQGTATVWTADRALKATLERLGAGQTIKAPKVASTPDAVAMVSHDQTQDYIRHLERTSDGPINAATRVSYKPEVATIRAGFNAAFSGRRLEQGVLAKVRLSESHMGSLHTISLTERLAPTPAAPNPGNSTTTVQVPEVFLSEISGEWLVPNDGILLISTGVNTVADAAGKAVVHETLAILDFGRTVEPAAVVPPTAQAAMLPACRVDGVAADNAIAMENIANLSMPRVPDRSYPEARDRDGNVIELPPLPEAYASADLNQIEPGSVLATAQTLPARRPGAMAADPALARTSFEPIPESEVAAGLSYYYEGGNKPAAGLAAVVESFLRKGMGRATAEQCAGLNPFGRAGSLFEPTPNTVPADPCVQMSGYEPGREPAFPALPGNTMINVGPDRQEPFPNRSLPDIVTNLDQQPCDTPACPAAGCPFSAEGCHDAPAAAPAGQPAQVTMGVSVQNATGTSIFDYQGKLSTVFRNPGTPEVQYIPLANGLSLQLQAKVVATPPTRDVAATPAAFAPR